MIPVFIGFICYFLTLEPCLKDYDTCLTELDKEKISRLLTLTIICISCLSFKMFLIIHFNIRYRWIKVFILSLIIAFLTLIYDTGNDFKSHGAYNRLFLYFGIPIGYLGYFLLLQIYLLNKKYGNKIVLSFLFLLLLIYISLYQKYNSSCDNWYSGMKDSKIDNTVGCILEKPKICNEVIFNNWFDVVYYINDDCSKRRNDNYDVVKEYAYLYAGIKKLTKMAYPRVEFWEQTIVCNYYEYAKSVMREIFNLDDNKISPNKKIKNEVYVDFTKPVPEVKIELKKEEKLANEREKIFNKNMNDGNVPTKNILFFFIDSMSRNHMKRKLPKLYKWMERFYKPDNSSKSELFQLLKYHGVGTWTNINLQPFFFGVPYTADQGTYSLTFFKERGYITGSTENLCSRDFVNLYSGPMSNLDWDYYDHDFTAFFCDPNFYSKEKVYSMLDGPYCYRKKCLYGKQTYEYTIEYANQFFEKYKDKPKMFRIGNIDAHEGTGESVKYVEDDMIKFLDGFEDNGHLDDSIVFFFSDHGYTMPGIHQILQSEDHVKELLLPFMYILLPKKMKNFEQIKENLKYNENKMVTPYDMHNSLLGLLNVEKKHYNKLGKDIFHNKFTRKEGCNHFMIKEEWCKCHYNDPKLDLWKP
jgi:hypothetical protein